MPPARADRYRIGERDLVVRSTDSDFSGRMRFLYGECGVQGTDEPAAVCCTVLTDEARRVGLARMDGSEPADLADFIPGVFTDRPFTSTGPDADGWREVYRTDAEDGRVAVRGSELLFRTSEQWRALVGSVAVSLLMRRQPELLFLHGGSVDVGGRGVLLIGGKGSGKTTLSLALAARGHGFLGDELAAVHLARRELLPVRRSLAVRPGPRSAAIDGALERAAPDVEIYPDGSERLRIEPARLLGDSAPPATPLRAIFFLDAPGAEAAVVSLEPSRSLLEALTPLGATLWGMPPARRAWEILSLLSSVPCHRLLPGDPDESATMIEHTMEGG